MKIQNDYFKIIVVNFIVQIALRFIETLLIHLNFGIQEGLISSELTGLLFDLIFTNTCLIVLFPGYLLLFRLSARFANAFSIFLIAITTVFHFLILKYFLYQLIPLDTFLYQYSLKEILFTVNTSEVSYSKTLLIIVLLVAIIYISYQLIKNREFSKRTKYAGYLFIILSLPIFVFSQISGAIKFNKFSLNKFQYFYTQSVLYFFKEDDHIYSKKDAIEYQNLHSSNSYINSDYPLLHKFENENVLGPFFKRFDSPPNIVIIIVEGLNDDFVHTYNGVDMMPFLEKLKNESLYWNRCFTLGERSFAVVPSITGSLPYGEKGFTLLDVLPNHLSLVSILKSNDYYTSFFDGQGSWFHRKNLFFNFNNIDLVFDNSRFDKKYKKVIVGKDNFFWGYNDKDLFNQSLEVLDTIRAQKKLTIYFTGTSHSPYAISDYPHYESQFSGILKSLKKNDEVAFFKTYKKYVLSELFVNDALEDFFNKYKKRPDFDNTIFIITGDHPMSEMPRANSLKRYHVPLIIYSPGLKEFRTFSKTVSQLDIYESLLSLLSAYNIKIPEVSTALGNKLNTNDSERDVKIAFMDDNRNIVDYLSNDYYISGKQLYKVNKDLSLTVSNDNTIKKRLESELKIFKKTSLYVSTNDKILPDSLYCQELGYKLLHAQHAKDATKFSTEFYNVVNSTKIPNKTFHYDISFNFSGDPGKYFSLVYQLSTGKDSMVLWKNGGVETDNKRFQIHLTISRQNSPDSILYFKSYFWNIKKQEFNFNNLKVLIYQ